MFKYLFITLLLFSCNTSVVSTKIPPEVFVETTDKSLRNANGTWMYKNEKLNGYIIEKDSNKTTAKVPVLDGKENGTAYGWYISGKKRYERNFLNGKRQGEHTGWHENDSLSFVYYFEDDKYEGEQKKYFDNGKPYQLLHYIKGYEDGKQKTWNKQGRLINNFTVKNKKLYGVIGRYDCMSVMEE